MCAARALFFGPCNGQHGGPREDGTHFCRAFGCSAVWKIGSSSERGRILFCIPNTPPASQHTQGSEAGRSARGLSMRSRAGSKSCRGKKISLSRFTAWPDCGNTHKRSMARPGDRPWPFGLSAAIFVSRLQNDAASTGLVRATGLMRFSSRDRAAVSPSGVPPRPPWVKDHFRITSSSWTHLPRQTMMCRQPLIAGAAYGRRGLAAEPRPREVRGGIPQERDRRDGPAQPDGGGPQGTWRHSSRAPPQTPRPERQADRTKPRQ